MARDLPSVGVAALVAAAEESDQVRALMQGADDEELEWLLEEPTPADEDDSAPPYPEAVAWRDRWLARRVDMVMKGVVTANVFCPTGPGGGIKPDCTAKGGVSGKAGQGVGDKKIDPKTGTQYTAAQLSESSLKAGNALYGNNPSHPSGLSWQPVTQVIHVKLSDLVKKGHSADDFEYVYHPSTGKGVEVSGQSWKNVKKEWVDKDGNVYVATGTGQTFVVKVDVPLSKVADLAPKAKGVEEDRSVKFGSYHKGQSVKIKKEVLDEFGIKLPKGDVQVVGVTPDGRIQVQAAGRQMVFFPEHFK
jgi:hypothetical protein